MGAQNLPLNVTPVALKNRCASRTGDGFAVAAAAVPLSTDLPADPSTE